jgi:hypothetical protein
MSSVARNEKNKIKNQHIRIFGFQWVAKTIEGWLKICTLLLVYSQIWLNLPTDDCQFGYKQTKRNSVHWCITLFFGWNIVKFMLVQDN